MRSGGRLTYPVGRPPLVSGGMIRARYDREGLRCRKNRRRG
nr:MAG TPA: hypothetical protein [Caudoviricetes sp.]